METQLKIKLYKYTQNPETVIATAAKLCYSGLNLEDLEENVEKNDNSKFIKMLFKLGHLSTFEHVSFIFLIQGISRALLAQITRHRIASFSVQSQRYVSMANFNYIIPKSIKEKGKDFENKFISQMEQINKWYNEWQTLLGGNMEKSNEEARFILPNACETKLMVTMNARELLHFFSLRCCNRAQSEIRELAWKMLGEVYKVAPNIFENAGPNCVRERCKEGSKSCNLQNKIIEQFKKIKNQV